MTPPSEPEDPSPRELRLAQKMYPYLAETGWIESRQTRRPVDREGRPLPWITYPAIAFLDGRVKPDFTVFEFGSGNSTLWWAERVSHVTCVEHDPEWAEEIASKVPDNVDFNHVALEPDGDYCRFAAASGRQYHVIVIDGRDRVNCALRSVEHLRDDGVFVWDNTERRRYEVGLRRLREMGFRQIGFRGPLPIVNWECETSVLYRPENCLGL